LQVILLKRDEDFGVNPYIVLLKPRVIWLLILASVAGYIYAAPQIEWNKLASLLLAAALSIGGSAAFNHYWERDIDALMARTAKRPLPAGLVPPSNALMYSLALSAAGIAAGFYLLGPLPGLFVALGWFFLRRSLHHVAKEEDLAQHIGRGLRRQRHLPRGLRPSQGHG
jgi:protoheme IX farnesyltransferase